MSCRFTGTLNDKLRGFYRSTYTGLDGETQTIATTQFESVDARRSFPCFDEPDRKAVFEVALDRRSRRGGHLELARGRRSTRSATSAAIRFSPTMKMSTYLVAFVVGKLETTETVDVDGVPLRVVCTPGQAPPGRTSPSRSAPSRCGSSPTTSTSPTRARRSTSSPSPTSPPAPWRTSGCITFRDTALLVDEAEAARTELERVADVIAHELAHMWFGDLVTMGWWEGIWLNEAFATFMETLCVDAFRPSWDRWVGFAPAREAALAVDGLHSTRPIEYPVGPPKEAEGMFDLLTYEKGCGVLRMLEQYIGPDVFRDGVRTYLKAHAYGNTVTADLWDALRGSQRRAGARRHGHLHPPGRAPARLPGGAARCASSRSRSAPCPPARRPPSAPNGACPSPCAPCPRGDTRGAGAAPGPRHGTGADRRSQPRASPWSTPAAGACSASATSAGTGSRWRSTCPELTPLERANLLADTWATTLAGHSRLERLPGPGLAARARAGPRTVGPGGQRPHAGQPDRLPEHRGPRCTRRSRHWSVRPSPTSASTPAPGDGERTPSLRSLAITLLGTVGADDAVRAEAARRFDASPIGGGSGEPIPADIEAATLAVVAQLVRPGDYDALLERYRTAATPQEEMRSLGALAAFPDVDLCLRTFDLAMTEVRSQNGFAVIGALLANPVGNQAVWTRLTESWDAVLERFPKNAPPRIIESLPALCADAEFAARRHRLPRRPPARLGAAAGRPVDRAVAESTWPSPPASGPGSPTRSERPPASA